MIRTLVLCGLGVCAASAAQPDPAGAGAAGTSVPKSGERPPPYPPGAGFHGERGDRGRGGERRGPGMGGMPGMPGIPGGFGRPPGGYQDAFDRLQETEKQRVRQALDKAWIRPEVIEARDKAMQANEDFRNAIRQALERIDPEVVKIMDRVRPQDQYPQGVFPKLPPPDSAEFPRATLQRLGLEMIGMARPEWREEAKRLHERLAAMPQIREARERAEATTGEERLQAIQRLRELYRQEVGREFQRIRERRPNSGPGSAPPTSPSASAPGDRHQRTDVPAER